MMGEATVTAVPDRAIVSGGVISDAATASEALEANAKAMSQVFASLKQLGIPERAIQTTSYSLDPQHPPYNEKTGLSSKIIGYRVTNEVQIKLDDIGRAGPALDALIESGANESAGVSFSIKDPKALERQARSEAGRDALDRAETYAKSVGAQLGRVRSIREGLVTAPIEDNVENVVVTAERRPAATPIAAGEQSVSAQVTVVWELK